MNFRTPTIAVALTSRSDITLDVANPLLQPLFQQSNPNTTPSDRHLADKQIRNLPKQAMCHTLEPSKPIHIGPTNRRHHSFPAEPCPPPTSDFVNAASCSDACNPTVPQLCLSEPSIPPEPPPIGPFNPRCLRSMVSPPSHTLLASLQTSPRLR
jgi:hypothetical protein